MLSEKKISYKMFINVIRCFSVASLYAK